MADVKWLPLTRQLIRMNAIYLEDVLQYSVFREIDIYVGECVEDVGFDLI